MIQPQDALAADILATSLSAIMVFHTLMRSSRVQTSPPAPLLRGEGSQTGSCPVATLVAQALPSEGRVADRPGEVRDDPINKLNRIMTESVRCD